MARHLITSAIPYINGIKHLGNLVGSQLPADLFARYQRARGHEVLFLCATDEHGTPAELAAAKAGQPVAQYCASRPPRPRDPVAVGDGRAVRRGADCLLPIGRLHPAAWRCHRDRHAGRIAVTAG